MATLHQKELDEIISKLNATIMGNFWFVLIVLKFYRYSHPKKVYILYVFVENLIKLILNAWTL